MQNLDHVMECACGASLERGYSSLYRDEKEVERICFECARNKDLLEYKQDRELHTHLVMDASSRMYDILKDEMHLAYQDRISALKRAEEKVAGLQNVAEETLLYAEVYLSYMRVNIKLKEFEDKVWFGGLQPIIRRSKRKGVSAHPKREDGFVVLTYSIAGRTMFTIEDKKNSITLITEEDSSERRMGLQGVHAAEKEALQLLDQAIEMWQKGELDFKDDDKVGII